MLQFHTQIAFTMVTLIIDVLRTVGITGPFHRRMAQ